jgi:phosphate transport system substrate-binding protein
LAPEQTTIETPIGPEADVWSFGLLAFMMLTGRHYFASANVKSIATAAVLREIVLDPLLAASERARQLGFVDRLPVDFDGWFGRCVHRVPKERFADARTAFDALAALTAPTPKEMPSPSEARLRAMSAMRTETPITAIETPHPSRAWRSRAPTNASVRTSTGGVDTVARRRPTAVLLAGASVVAAIGVALAVWARGERASPPPKAPLATPAMAIVSADLRLHGSNTIGAELAPALAEAFLQRRTAAKATVRRRTAPDEVLVEARDAERTIESIEIFAHGSTTAFEDLAGARCDLGMASRRIREDEASKLAPLGDLQSAASEHVIALDGIAVIVNPTNIISTLTRTQIGDLFTGKVRRWSDLGGKDQPVVVHARDDRSGTYDTFKHLVLPDRALVANAVRHESSEELSDAVAGDARAVGFIGLSYVRSAKAVMVEDSGSVPLLPSPMTVSTEDYTLARRLYLYVPATASVIARDFVDFALSDAGQNVVRAAGFVDLLPDCDAALSRCPACPRDYLESVRGACRVSIDFRFEHDSLELDTRALRDLPRVAAMLARAEYAGRGLVLMGFSDGTGARATAVSLSQQRADIVAQQLRARGLHILVERGFGPDMPVADDSTEEGRERNRRVEAWLR